MLVIGQLLRDRPPSVPRDRPNDFSIWSGNFNSLYHWNDS